MAKRKTQTLELNDELALSRSKKNTVVATEHEEINHCEIEKKEVLGIGTFGTVYKAFWQNQYVAIKHIHQDSNFMLQMDNLLKLQHQNIIKFYGTYRKNPNLFLMMELADCGSLYYLLHDNRQFQYTIGHAMRWVKQCAEGVAYLHSIIPKPIIHGDLKSSHLLAFNCGNLIKICGFTMATETKTPSIIGSVQYMAPEVFKEIKYNEKCDVYSWGIILWEVLSRKKPFKEVDNIFSIMYIVGNGVRPPPIQKCPKKIENLMTTCWDQNDVNRPAMGDVINTMNELCQYFCVDDIPLNSGWDLFEKEIDHREIKSMDSFSGLFGLFYKTTWKDQKVVVTYIKEVYQLNLISHPNIVSLYGVCNVKPKICLVMEFCNGGSLYDLLHKTSQIQYTPEHAMNWMKQCAEAVAFLHSMLPQPLIHRDLKSQNLLLSGDGGVLKINAVMTMDKGTISYMAPEVCQGNEYTEKCDVYSWGIILWEVISREQPFKGIDQDTIKFMVGMGNRPPLTRELSNANLMISCWDHNPSNRPAMIDIVKQMLELCKSFPNKVQPIFIPDQF